MSDLLNAADIERLTESAGLTIADLCREAGVAPSIFSRWKAGITSPSYRNYQRISEALDALLPPTVLKRPSPLPPKSRGAAPARRRAKAS